MKEYKTFIINSIELKREVRVSVFLPKSYRKTDKYYPVLYMHDGQNLFDDNIAYDKKSWGIMEAYENDKSIPEVIVVGIDSAESRTEELVPFVFNYGGSKELVGGNARIYYEFITKTLKTFIDKRYRTLKSAKNTGIMGSSYGGLSSTYAAIDYSEFFTRFGCVSNSYFPVQKEIEDLVKKATFSTVEKFYIDVGTKESSKDEYNEMYLVSNQSVFDLLSEKIDPERLRFKVIEGGIHHGSAWEKRFPEIMKFLFSE